MLILPGSSGCLRSWHCDHIAPAAIASNRLIPIVERWIHHATGTDHAGARVTRSSKCAKCAIAIATLEKHVGTRVAARNLAAITDLNETLALVPLVGKRGTHARDGLGAVEIAGEKITAVATLLVSKLHEAFQVLAHLDGDQAARFVALRRIVRL